MDSMHGCCIMGIVNVVCGKLELYCKSCLKGCNAKQLKTNYI